ncbi:hypothetical protein [Dyadobacter chenhuakuii]|uniref:Uncharacterized protein n=1 Tax=Dyadobacter chenhuakuii TaxID=2909339 RepID=A0ABY5E716_9BACT|nr:hypothetical protein [Dyadobacter chenhuakuii]UTM21741.1 hypothetical protein NFI80_25445 [Dyadobacter chenhuakuii]
MRSILIALVIFSMQVYIYPNVGFQNKHVDIKIGGTKWALPSTVGDAVKRHALNYKPPGYYYKNYPNKMEVILSVNDQPGDYFKENQPKEALFDRTLNGYIFRFPQNQINYDSLKVDIETTYKKKFKLTKGRKEATTLREDQMQFEYDFLMVDDKLTIGIHKSPTLVVVRYMYGMSIGKMGVKMGSYLHKR